MKGNHMLQLTPRQLAEFLPPYFAARKTVLIKGKPGIGKTDVVTQSAKVANSDIIISHPVVEDPTNAKGMPWMNGGDDVARFIPFDQLAQVLRATSPTVWFLDDFGQASPAVQASYMQWLLARRLGEHTLPDCVTICAATNSRSDNAAVSGMLSPVKSRFTIVELTADVESWGDWAVKHLDETTAANMLAFFRRRPELLLSNTVSRDIENEPSPRNWSELLTGPALAFQDDALRLAGIQGRVGEAAATELVAFLKMMGRGIDPAVVLKKPDTAPIPNELDVLYALCVALEKKAGVTTADAIFRYVERLHAAGKGDVAAMLANNSFNNDKAIMGTAAFTRFSSSEVGTIIFNAYRV